MGILVDKYTSREKNLCRNEISRKNFWFFGDFCEKLRYFCEFQRGLILKVFATKLGVVHK